MSCPDWSRLAVERRAAAGAAEAQEPDSWREAVEHLDGCGGCRSEALAAEPLLLFRRLPAVEADAATVDDIRAGVAALRRAHRVAGAADSERTGDRRRESLRWWGRVAAAILLATGLLGLRQDAPDAARAVASGPPASESVAALGGGTVFAVDDIEHPTASVYHFDDEDLGVVMVVDAGLDV